MLGPEGSISVSSNQQALQKPYMGPSENDQCVSPLITKTCQPDL